MAIMLVLLIIIMDQLTKQWIASQFVFRQSEAITSFFNLGYYQNKGAAFSFLANAGGWQRWFFVVLTSSIIMGILIWIKTQDHIESLLYFGLLCVLGGAIGNLIDRVLLGYVIDFLDFHYKDYHYPAFNIADSSIFIGAVCLFLTSFSSDSNHE